MAVKSWYCAMGASLVLIAGCRAPQLGTSGSIPQASTAGAHAQLQSERGDLLYYSGSGSSGGETYIFSFPQGKLVASFSAGGSLCPDKAGNVWLSGYPNQFGKELAEYAHGGLVPIKVLKVPHMERLFGCAVDPTTGDLAVMGSRHHIAIFSGASPPAKVLRVNFYPAFCTYDDSGNLFVLGQHENSLNLVVAELPAGGRKFTRLLGLSKRHGL